MHTADERSVRERLEAWELRIQRILAMYDKEGKVPADLSPQVRALYGALRLNLRAAFKVGDSAEGRAQMSEAERQFYHPAIEAACARLAAPVESNPEAWFGPLCDALADISDAVVSLDEHRV